MTGNGRSRASRHCRFRPLARWSVRRGPTMVFEGPVGLLPGLLTSPDLSISIIAYAEGGLSCWLFAHFMPC